VRCGRCGNENAEGNRFCGMCGNVLLVNEQAGGQAAVAAGGGGRSPSSEAKAEAGAGSGPVITGPSFLGLNTPVGGTGSGRGVQSDRHGAGGQDALRPSSNVDYLLEDVDEPRRGWGKLILVVVALALALGFGYLHWKRGGFDWVNAGDKKPPAATAQTPDAGQSGADSGAGAAAPGGGAPQGGTNGAPVGGPGESGAGQATPGQSSSQGAPAQSAPAQAAAPQSGEPRNSAPSGAGDSEAAEAAEAPEAGEHGAGSGSDKPAPAAEAAPRAVARKPAAAKPAAARAVDSVTEAERYIYGRGVAQDCDRGLRMLKPAAESNVKAMVSFGALYSTGTCTPRDLPTAYRWFALALHKEPDNQALQADLQKLWGQMTQPERQLAIKLSQ
jgi:hypothetical protein